MLSESIEVGEPERIEIGELAVSIHGSTLSPAPKGYLEANCTATILEK